MVSFELPVMMTTEMIKTPAVCIGKLCNEYH